jgi:hypothetical protein
VTGPAPPRPLVLGLVLLALSAGAAAAKEPDDPNIELYRAYYRYNVADYCGLVSDAVYDGYRQQIDHLIDRDALDEPWVRWLRIRGAIDAEIEFLNRGMGGYKPWCRSEGASAARSFLEYAGRHRAADARR